MTIFCWCAPIYNNGYPNMGNADYRRVFLLTVDAFVFPLMFTIPVADGVFSSIVLVGDSACVPRFGITF
jgi:hypothetical protein